MRRALPPALPQPATPLLFTGAAHRRAHQVRRQRLPGHQDHLHQRDRRPVRAGRRRRAGRGARHRPRQPHRREVPARRPRLRRLVLPQGHAGPGARPRRTSARRCRIVETVVAVNDQRKRAMARKVIAACGGSVRGKTIAVLGLTFKPNTDDMRDAPSLAIITALQDAGAKVRAYDPEGMEQARSRARRTSTTPTTPTPASRAPTRSSSSPSGTSSAPSTSSACASSLQAPRRRRPAQHLPSRGDGPARLHLCQRRPARLAASDGDAGLRR